jgi:hypothetical protein
MNIIVIMTRTKNLQGYPVTPPPSLLGSCGEKLAVKNIRGERQEERYYDGEVKTAMLHRNEFCNSKKSQSAVETEEGDGEYPANAVNSLTPAPAPDKVNPAIACAK